jgi:hypothetical protein
MKDGRRLAFGSALEQPGIADVAGDLRDARVVHSFSRDDVDESDSVNGFVVAGR